MLLIEFMSSVCISVGEAILVVGRSHFVDWVSAVEDGIVVNDVRVIDAIPNIVRYHVAITIHTVEDDSVIYHVPIVDDVPALNKFHAANDIPASEEHVKLLIGAVVIRPTRHSL
jgi:hypothetical protein